MVRLFSIAFLCFIAVAARAQDRDANKLPATPTTLSTATPITATPPPASHIDLTRDPQAAPAAVGTTPNATLLMPAGQGGSQTYNTVQTTPGINGNTQQVKATSTEFNLGNKKATNTYYYDNTGKMTGSGTTIKIGGK